MMHWVKQAARAGTIFRLSWRYGLDVIALSLLGRNRLARALAALPLRGDISAPRGMRIRQFLEELGPIFVKFGQVLSTRRDLLSPDIADELRFLQDRVPIFDPALAVEIIERNFGKPLTEIFSQFDHQPIASASIAQVHFALVRDKKTGIEQPVAVKVLRPGMLSVIEKDLSLMRQMASWVQRFSRDGKRLKPLEVVAEFDKYLHDELDLMREASNATQLRRNMADMPTVKIPEIYWDWCRPEVMTMQRMNGTPVSQTTQLRAAGVDLSKLARQGVILFFTQVFRDGFFHADMHPGNLLVSTEAQDLGRFVLLDFGIVGSLTDTDKQYLAKNFAAFFERDYRRVALLHIESGWIGANTNVNDLESALRSVCEPYFAKPLREISLGLVLMRLFQVSRRFEMQIQPQLVLLQKTLLNVEGLARELDPDMDLWSAAKPFLTQWVQEQVGVPALVRELKAESLNWARILPALPRLLHDYLGGSKDSSKTAGLESEKLVQALLQQQSQHAQELAHLRLQVKNTRRGLICLVILSVATLAYFLGLLG